MIKGVIFDCYGVVITDAFSSAYESFGGDLEKDKEFINRLIAAVCKGQIPSAVPAVAERLRISEADWTKKVTSSTSINKELLEYILELRTSYKISMLSNASKGGLAKVFGSGFLEKYFDTVVVSGDIGYAKPEREAYETTANLLGLKLDECLFIDDRQNYIEGAELVGMKGILYLSNKQVKTEISTALDL